VKGNGFREFIKNKEGFRAFGPVMRVVPGTPTRHPPSADCPLPDQFVTFAVQLLVSLMNHLPLASDVTYQQPVDIVIHRSAGDGRHAAKHLGARLAKATPQGVRAVALSRRPAPRQLTHSDGWPRSRRMVGGQPRVAIGT
jgi:hypothetical protein